MTDFAGALTSDKSEEAPARCRAGNLTRPPLPGEGDQGPSAPEKRLEYAAAPTFFRRVESSALEFGRGNWNSVGGLQGWRMGVLPGFQNTKQVVSVVLAGWLGERREGRREYKVGRLLQG